MFEQIAELLSDNEVTTMTFSMVGERMRINIIPKAKEGKTDPIPLSVCATPAELDAGFITAIKSYTERTKTLSEQMEAYNKQAEAAVAEAKDAAEKSKASSAKTATPSTKPVPKVSAKSAPETNISDLF